MKRMIKSEQQIRKEIKSVAKRWAKQYPVGHEYGEQKDIITKKLKCINLNHATAKDIENIIGNSSWIENGYFCDQCHQMRDSVIKIAKKKICDFCLEAARKIK